MRSLSGSLVKKLFVENMQEFADMSAFRNVLKNASRIVILTGAGVSAESGVPTFRGAGGFWRTFQAQKLATPEAFRRNPSLVWKFYHYRREVVLSKSPNPAHIAIAEFEDRMASQGKHVTVITQNVDELHRKAGTKNLIELYGSLFTTKCLTCKEEAKNYVTPICPALKDKGAPDDTASDAKISESDLPRCKSCSGLLRPGVVWFGENLNPAILKAGEQEVAKCDVCLVVGTSAVVYPAAMFAPDCARRGVPVAEFNLESTPSTQAFQYHFEGPCGATLCYLSNM